MYEYLKQTKLTTKMMISISYLTTIVFDVLLIFQLGRTTQ